MIFSRKEQRKNVEFLARFLEKNVQPRRFDMFFFRDSTKGCGTVGCALGWSTFCPTLKRRGVGDADPVQFAPTINGNYVSISEYADVVFGDDSWENLFSSRLGARLKTPKQWAAHARQWLRETA